MTKKTQYVIILSQQFPALHNRKGDPTHFATNFIQQIKITTIRNNYPLWKKRFKKIDEGKAELSIRVWTGLPRKSKQQEIGILGKEDGIGLQKIDFSEDYLYSFKIDNKVSGWSCDKIATNDGLSQQDFENWFAQYDLSEPMALIHFSDFRY